MSLIQADLSDDTTKITILILNAIWLLILTPILVYHAKNFWAFNQHQISFFTKRHPKLVLFIVTIALMYPIIFRPIVDYALLFQHDTQFKSAIVLLVSNIVQLYPIPLAIRVWLLYYDYNHALHSLTMKWKSQILPTDYPLPWYMTPKYKWTGNGKSLAILGLIFSVILILFIIVIDAVFQHLAPMLWQLNGFCCIVFILILAVKVKECRDGFAIKKEFGLAAISVFGTVLLWISTTLVFPVGSNVRIIVGNMTSVGVCYTVCFIQTMWVIRQYVTQLKLHSNTEELTHFKLEQVLSTKDGFDLFANHVVKEFSIENLFFVFEMMQMKHDLVENRLIDDDEIGINIKIEESIIAELRRKDSQIRNVKEMKLAIEHIMTQYIDQKSKYGVNISAIIRKDINEKYEDLSQRRMTYVALTPIGSGSSLEIASKHDIMEDEMRSAQFIKDFITMFDDALEGVITLLRLDSLSRFYDTKEYKTWSYAKDNGTPGTPSDEKPAYKNTSSKFRTIGSVSMNKENGMSG